MKLYPFLFIGIVMAMVSCDLGGVQGNNDSQEDIAFNDSTAISLENNIDSTVSDEPYALLKDTILGEPNNMVFQREDGLRVEWTIKKDDPIQLNEVVLVNYSARIAGGDEYDSNSELGEPVPLKTNIGMMVEGWEDGLLEMNIGDKGRIMIPTALAYSDYGYDKIVPPGADIIVEIEIVERVKPIELEEGVKVYTWKKNEHGVTPTKNQLITFDYIAFTKGKDGHMYDNSFQNQAPFSFSFENDNVVDGLHQGMSVLKQEENAFIEIPAKLAYGSSGLVDMVPKNTDIVYDVRVLSID